jgi:hypothetical protein
MRFEIITAVTIKPVAFCFVTPYILLGGTDCENKFIAVYFVAKDVLHVAALYYQFGMFIVLLLGSFMHWKTTAAVSAVMPIVTLLLLIPVMCSPPPSHILTAETHNYHKISYPY